MGVQLTNLAIYNTRTGECVVPDYHVRKVVTLDINNQSMLNGSVVTMSELYSIMAVGRITGEAAETLHSWTGEDVVMAGFSRTGDLAYASGALRTSGGKYGLDRAYLESEVVTKYDSNGALESGILLGGDLMEFYEWAAKDGLAHGWVLDSGEAEFKSKWQKIKDGSMSISFLFPFTEDLIFEAESKGDGKFVVRHLDAHGAVIEESDLLRGIRPVVGRMFIQIVALGKNFSFKRPTIKKGKA